MASYPASAPHNRPIGELDPVGLPVVCERGGPARAPDHPTVDLIHNRDDTAKGTTESKSSSYEQCRGHERSRIRARSPGALAALRAGDQVPKRAITPTLGVMPAVGELVRCTDGSWMTRPPQSCPHGHPLGPDAMLVGHQPCSTVAVDIPPGRAWNAAAWCTGHRSPPVARFSSVPLRCVKRDCCYSAAVPGR
jgi:hypothetical protein